MDCQKEIRKLKSAHNYFVGIDSDGCVFDPMEVKQKEFRKNKRSKPVGMS